MLIAVQDLPRLGAAHAARLHCEDQRQRLFPETYGLTDALFRGSPKMLCYLVRQVTSVKPAHAYAYTRWPAKS